MASPAAAPATTATPPPTAVPAPAAPVSAVAPPTAAAVAAAGGAKKPLNLANKPGEPPFQLKIEPSDSVVMPWAKGVTSSIDLKITNPSTDPHSFKVKCTDNNMFRVRPPLGFIEAGQTLPIKIFQTSNEMPEENRHFFAIYHKKCTVAEAKAQPRNVWKADTKPDGVIRLLATFKPGAAPAAAAAGPPTPEKKEEKK